jgi:hypothetical protein
MARLRTYKTEEELAQARRERQRRYYAAMSIEQRRAMVARKNRSAAQKKRPNGIAIAPSACPTLPAKPVQRRESVDDWMKRTGKEPEVLPGFTGTRPWRPVAIPQTVMA